MQKFLKPISADQPCGPDLSYASSFSEFETALQGKPEVEIGSVVRPAEPPDWRALTGQAEALFAQTKDLRVAVVLGCCWLKQEGALGFLDGLEVIRGLLEQYWEKLYPALDPDDDNDPTQRLNVLRALTTPRGGVTGWIAFAEYLHEMPLGQPKGAPAVTYGQIIQARKKEQGGATGSTDLSAVMQALQSTGAEQISPRRAALQASLEAAQAIDQFLTSKLGSGETFSFEVLETLLRDLIAVLDACVPGAAAAAVAVAGEPPGSGGGATQVAPITIGGAIRSRDDVIRALEGICAYYRQIEPGSPVPFLLRRAQKLAAMNFVQAMQELNLASLEALRPSMGSTVDGAEATPATS